MAFKIDRRKSTRKLLDESLVHINWEYEKLQALKNPSQFEKGKLFAYMEMKTSFNKIFIKEL